MHPGRSKAGLTYRYVANYFGKDSREKPFKVNAQHFTSSDIYFFFVVLDGAGDFSCAPVCRLAFELGLVHFIKWRTVCSEGGERNRRVDESGAYHGHADV